MQFEVESAIPIQKRGLKQVIWPFEVLKLDQHFVSYEDYNKFIGFWYDSSGLYGF